MGNGSSKQRTKLGQQPSLGLLSVRKLTEFDQQYELVRELGAGVTAQVFLIRARKTGKEMAMKTINLKRVNIKQIEELRKEVSLLKSLQHPNVLRLVEVYESQKEMKLVMEFCKGGDLLRGRSRLRTEKDIAYVIYQLLLAIEHIHSKGIVHRDIKLENVMFVSDDPASLEIQLIDFGFSGEQRKNLFRFRDKRLMTTLCGTSLYMAPEVLEREYGNQCDVWSVGVLSYILITGKAPFVGETREETFRKIKIARLDFSHPIWRQISPDAQILVSNLLVVDPNKRWTAQHALKSAWFEAAKQKVVALEANVDTGIVESLSKFSQYAQLKKIALMVIAHHAAGEELSALRAVFAALDKDNSATITYAELRQYLTKFGVSEKEANTLFSSMDIDDSGEIQLIEFLAATIETACSIDRERMADAFDNIAKGDQYITSNHLEKILGKPYKSRIKEMIRSVDKNSDGKINKQEFLAMIEENLEDALEGAVYTGELSSSSS